MYFKRVHIIKHIALTGSSNKNLLFTDKINILQKKIWTTCHFSFYSRPIESFLLQFYPELLLSARQRQKDQCA